MTDESLKEMVSKKHAGNTDTDIICKNFLDALENNKYGWFWECPNGGKNCKYRHMLPKGFVLKEKALADKKEKKEKEKKGTVSGRDLFLKDPAMLARHVEEDDGEDFDLTREQDDDDGTKVHEIKFDEYGIMDDGVDEST